MDKNLMRSSKGTLLLPASSSTLPLKESQLRSLSKKDSECMLLLISGSYYGCNSECDHGYDQSIHEHIVGYAKLLVFASQHHALRIHIFNKAAVQIVPIVHHMQHASRIIIHGHSKKIPKE